MPLRLLLLSFATLCAATALIFVLGSPRELGDATLSRANLTRIAKQLPAPIPDSSDLWRSPRWKVPYAVNPVPTPQGKEAISEWVVVYEPAPLWKRRTTRYVLFADGHVKLVAEENWPKVRSISKLSEISAPLITSWWRFGGSGPREPIPEVVLSRLFGLIFALLVLIAARLRVKTFGAMLGTVALYLGVCGVLGMMLFVFFASLNTGRIG
jgi:prepilin-type processing-associated H-X9-DG protein